MKLHGVPRARGWLDDTARSEAPGEFVPLSDGITHYEMAGPPAQRPVVLIHGFSVPSFVWEPTFEGLAEAGFRVLRYDLFGRGYSDRFRTRYDLDVFVHQLRDLIDVLALVVPVDLVGLSMGGAIAVGFADRYPAVVRRLALIAPAGYQVEPPRGTRWLRTPLLGELLMGMLGRRVMLLSLSRAFSAVQRSLSAEQVSAMMRTYLRQLQYKGSWQALLSTMRHGPICGMAETYARVGRQDRRTLLIWGREDRTVPFALSDAVRAAMPRAEYHAIDGAGHTPHLERPQLITRLLSTFLRSR